jgi:parallel beta-helix repeat protein
MRHSYPVERHARWRPRGRDIGYRTRHKGAGGGSGDGPGESNVRRSTFSGGDVSASAGATGTIEDNDFSGGEGIGVDTGSSMVIRGNTIRDVAGPAVEVRDEGTSATVEDNTITGSFNGIAVRSGTAATVSDNTLTENGLAVSLETGDVTASDNSIDGGNAGIWVNAGAPTLAGNSVRGMKGNGITVMAAASPTLSGNRSCDNVTNLFVADGATPSSTTRTRSARTRRPGSRAGFRGSMPGSAWRSARDSLRTQVQRDDLKIPDPREVPRVAGVERQAVGDGDGGDHGVVRPCGRLAAGSTE